MRERVKSGKTPDGYVETDEGTFPQDWRFLQLSEVVRVFRGASPRPKGDPKYYGGIIPRLLIEDVTRDGKYVFPSVDSLTEEGAKKSRYVPKGTVVLSCSGTRVAIPGILGIPACIHDGFFGFDDYKDLLPEYLYYYFELLHEKMQSSATTGGVFNNLTTQIMKEMRIQLPGVKEQEKIVETITTWDKAIELKEKLIEQKKEQKKGLMQKLLMGQIRWNDREKYTENQLIERNNMIINKGVPIGYKKVKRFVIPQEWEFMKIEKVCQQVLTTNKDNKSYVVLSCTKYDGLVDSLKYFDRQVFGSDLSKYRVVSKNEFAYATNHIEEGSIGLLREYDIGLVSPMYTVFKTKNTINAEFLFALLKTENYRRIFESMMSASVDRRGSLRWNEFSKIEVPIPSLDEQGKIISIILTAQKEITILENELEEIKNQKKGLMQLLLTGKVRVKV